MQRRQPSSKVKGVNKVGFRVYQVLSLGPLVSNKTYLKVFVGLCVFFFIHNFSFDTENMIFTEFKVDKDAEELTSQFFSYR